MQQRVDIELAVCYNICIMKMVEEKIRYYEEDNDTGKIIPLQEDTIPDSILVLVDDTFDEYLAKYGESTEGVIVRDPKRNINIVATKGGKQ